MRDARLAKGSRSSGRRSAATKMMRAHELTRASGSSSLSSDPRSAWSRLAACTVAAALLQLDGTLITVALPAVAHGLHISASSTSVVLSAYFAASALLLIPGGELVDRFGARRLALIGLALFAVGAAAGAPR